MLFSMSLMLGFSFPRWSIHSSGSTQSKQDFTSSRSEINLARSKWAPRASSLACVRAWRSSHRSITPNRNNTLSKKNNSHFYWSGAGEGQTNTPVCLSADDNRVRPWCSGSTSSFRMCLTRFTLSMLSVHSDISFAYQQKTAHVRDENIVREVQHSLVWEFPVHLSQGFQRSWSLELWLWHHNSTVSLINPLTHLDLSVYLKTWV